ncbi:MAG: hypothetical protein JWM11_2993 [Planctomycetaceae bacterium]|nr:hypothetical protein [Planctomycetaceae bacterium]
MDAGANQSNRFQHLATECVPIVPVPLHDEFSRRKGEFISASTAPVNGTERRENLLVCEKLFAGVTHRMARYFGRLLVTNVQILEGCRFVAARAEIRGGQAVLSNGADPFKLPLIISLGSEFGTRSTQTIVGFQIEHLKRHFSPISLCAILENPPLAWRMHDFGVLCFVFSIQTPNTKHQTLRGISEKCP